MEEGDAQKIGVEPRSTGRERTKFNQIGIRGMPRLGNQLWPVRECTVITQILNILDTKDKNLVKFGQGSILCACVLKYSSSLELVPFAENIAILHSK